MNGNIQPVTAQWLTRLLPARQRQAHKGHFGHVLVIGGDHGYGGAAIMAAQSAVHCGAGLVSLFTQPEHISATLSRQPEVMVSHQHFSNMLARATVLLAGPGLGLRSWGSALMAQILASDKPLLLDADALNYLAALPQAEQQQLKRDNWLLTPHPGEAARLLGCSSADIQHNRLAAVQQLQQRFGGTVLLKGHASLIAGPQQLARLDCGNPGMACGGMGDVLSGIIAALLAQGLTGFDAAALGGWLHGTAADQLAAIQGERGLTPTAILPRLQLLLNGKS
ncbi:NAD(P)H-hydrate dehydratase [Rheinheimera oceanensis]|uniref:NAD(P)H-hydrate dehydratase n=1 Tax=Rheinheimera oceanensis TaxID=2817449 RepID=UPI001BFECB80|nr:NAD(P)H-hydrate dehydratase [Rheinheimera oceanensis]